ncbi:hypothetical protein QP185_17970 [Sphingomonas aerolata]|uniref:hypothetical protein n=1 Tax=Sphingomonas aerolata TaxID=185951 RepID=UPI002FE3578A
MADADSAIGRRIDTITTDYVGRDSATNARVDQTASALSEGDRALGIRVEATGATRESVAAVVIAQADAWVQVGSAIEGLRMGAKAGIDRATTLGAIVAAAAVDWSAFGG